MSASQAGQKSAVGPSRQRKSMRHKQNQRNIQRPSLSPFALRCYPNACPAGRISCTSNQNRPVHQSELLGFGEEDHVSAPVPEAILDPQEPSDPPRRHMGITAKSLPPPLLRPQWMRILWGPPAMEITRGGELRVQVKRRDTPAQGKDNQDFYEGWWFVCVGRRGLHARRTCKTGRMGFFRLPKEFFERDPR